VNAVTPTSIAHLFTHLGNVSQTKSILSQVAGLSLEQTIIIVAHPGGMFSSSGDASPKSITCTTIMPQVTSYHEYGFSSTNALMKWFTIIHRVLPVLCGGI